MAAIIDDVTFQRVGKILDKNRRKYKPYKQGKMPYLFSGVTCCMTCGNPMSGKSATGRAGKVGYYEHVWATKRDSTLSKRIFKCDPHRVPSKILEPAVWEKMVSFATHPEFARRVFEKVKSHHKENPHRQEIERTKAKVFGVNSQIEALSERIAELPKGISAEPLFRQLEKLQAAQKDNEKVLADLKNGSLTNFDRIASLDTFDDFAKHYRNLVLKDLTVTQKKQFVQKFVKKIEVGVKTYKIHFIVDEEHFKRELALKEAGFQPFGARRLDSQDFFVRVGSNTLTNGARKRT